MGCGGVQAPNGFAALCHVGLFMEAVAFLQHDIMALRACEICAAILIVADALETSDGDWLDCVSDAARWCQWTTVLNAYSPAFHSTSSGASSTS
jgi:hypothetical protein